MTDLINGEFEFRGVKFGSTRSGLPLKEGGFSVGATTFETQDEDNPVGDGRNFGVDSLHGSTYTFDTWVVKEQTEAGWRAASARMSEFRSTWHGSPNRHIPRAVDELLIWHGDRVGLVFGRARNYSEDRNRLRKGWGSILCDFAAVDDMVYDEFEDVHLMTMVASTGGGLVAPLVAPLVGAGSGNRVGFFDVGGDADTPVVVTFHGPVVNPRLTVTDSWTIGLNDVLSYDETVTVDSRLWNRNVIRRVGTAIGSSPAGVLTRDSISLDKLVLSPGTHEAVFEGIDPSNTATVSIARRSARHSV